jgi:hypothetical protein
MQELYHKVFERVFRAETDAIQIKD